jgi:hypothetical protein
MKVAQIKKDLFNWRKLSSGKIVKYISLTAGSVIIICVLAFIFFPDPFVNILLKGRITKAVAEKYPAYSIRFGDLHYSVWKNRLDCDSMTLKTSDSTFTCSAASISVGGISWVKILWKRDFALNDLRSSVINARKIILNFRKSQDELSIRMLNISVPDSQMVTDSIKYHSLINDEKFFGKSKFRQTRFGFILPQLKIMGLDYVALLQRNTYSARSIKIHNVFVDVLVNMDKPYDRNSPDPKMPNEFLSSIKNKVKIDSVNIKNGSLKYCERYSIGSAPGLITIKKANVSISGISNDKAHPDTAVINAGGLFMKSGIMKLHMVFPLASKHFSLRYSGSLSPMDLTELNSFIEPGENQRIKSGVIQSAAFNINVNSGRAGGSLRVLYSDLSVALLNENTGSEKGVFNRAASFFGKTFIIRESNIPDENGLMKIGEIKYTRNPDDYFLQFVWFALRSGVGDVVGF